MSLFGRDQVEGQPQSLSVPVRFAKGTDMSFFSIVSFPFSSLPMIKSKSFETVFCVFQPWVISLHPGRGGRQKIYWGGREMRMRSLVPLPSRRGVFTLLSRC